MPLIMSEKRSVTNEMRDEYRKAGRRRKSQILDEVCRLCGYNRSYAARKLRKEKQTRSHQRVSHALRKPQGRHRIYGPECVGPLIKVWSVMDLACGKRIAAGMADTLEAMIRFGEIDCDEKIISKLKVMSASTIDRLLSVERKKMCPKGRSTTRPGTLLKCDIPIRLGTEWDEDVPGYVEMDTVSHCGESTRGQYVVTLDVTDIKTTWSEQRACLNKAQKHVFSEVKEIRARLPFKLLGMDTDSGGEFINNEMYRYCKAEGITFTRGRPYKKNDGCHIEQKNWSVVRQTTGYGRFETQTECDILNMVYDHVRLINNFYLPSQKLESKARDGSRIIRKLDKPQTPYRRVMASKYVDASTKSQLSTLFKTLNPAELRREITRLVNELYTIKEEREKM